MGRGKVAKNCRPWVPRVPWWIQQGL